MTRVIVWTGCTFLFSLLLSANSSSGQAAEGSHWRAGFARVDATPDEPVRMAGYGSRNRPSEGVDMRLYVRCIALKANAESALNTKPSVLLSVDTIGLPASLTREVAKAVESKHGIPREQIVFCSTHTHCGPDLVSELSNIFSAPLSKEETDAGNRYKQKLIQTMLTSIDRSLADMRPAQLAYDVGEVGFAANRRVLKNNRWTGFGVQADGPVDHSVPVLRISDESGNVRGIVFNYACHCTTIGGDYYNINADWAGYACANLEAAHEDIVALCTIGCGADANPEPRGNPEIAKLHGRALSDEVSRVVHGQMSIVDSPITARFDYASLPFDLPTKEELQITAEDNNPQTRRHAETHLKLLAEHGRLPATYPVPIQAWKFGDQLTMIFIGGEVVIDYAIRLKKLFGDERLWVTAYANDVLGYIASERMRTEGGYEYDRSGIYYNLPGPWASGTEDTLVNRIKELVNLRGRSPALDADAALRTFKLHSDFRIELVAAEPLVQDPVNLAFDDQGRMWVVEMGDYPEAESLGRVKCLTDRDGDGRFETTQLFLDKLAFPTGVFPWRDGVLISCAPDILFARDTNDDGKADEVRKLYTGFALANPQHRINGFTYGLDHSLHLASGDNLGEITSLITGDKINASGHDVQIWPDSGKLATTSGRTQFIRSCNDWGEWFGNDNSRPMFHFPIPDAYFARNPHVSYGSNSQQMFSPASAPPVHPAVAAQERFNDLFAANRFTSACSSIIARSPGYGAGSNELDPNEIAFICEPVHNLVHRAVLSVQGSTYRAIRLPEEATSEFLTSSDSWFRPVRVIVGPDGAMYLVDMYRETIEHPEWIPESWQKQLDIRAGADRGRIYRITRKGSKIADLDLHSISQDSLVDELRSPIGSRRDLVSQRLIEAGIDRFVPALKKLAGDHECPHGRVHALSLLQTTGQLETSLLLDALASDHTGVLLVAMRLSEPRIGDSADVLRSVLRVLHHPDQRVVLQAALTLGENKSAEAADGLAVLACRDGVDEWCSRAIVSSASHHPGIIIDALMKKIQSNSSTSPQTYRLLTDLLKTASRSGIDIIQQHTTYLSRIDDLDAKWKISSCFVSALGAREKMRAKTEFGLLRDQALDFINDSRHSSASRINALQWMGLGLDEGNEETHAILRLVTPQTPVDLQLAAIDALARMQSNDAFTELLARWPSMTRAVRDRLVGHALERTVWAERFVDAIESGAVNVNDLSPSAKQQLAHTGSRSLRVRAERLTRSGGGVAKRELVQRYKAALPTTGDTSRGAALFKQHCANCHLASEGKLPMGASLANLTDRSDDALLTAILDPNRAIDPKYLSYVILTNDDRSLNGVIADESGSGITIQHADGKETHLPRSEIAEIKSTGISLMPEGFENILMPDAMRDLLSYLSSDH